MVAIFLLGGSVADADQDPIFISTFCENILYGNFVGLLMHELNAGG